MAFLSGFCVRESDAGDLSVGCLRKSVDLSIVQQAGIVGDGGAKQCHQQAGIIELTIVVQHSATQPLRFQHRDSTKDFLC